MFHRTIVLLTLGYCILIADTAIIPIRDQKGRLSIVEWTNYNYREPEGVGTYAFGYDIDDPDTNNVQFRNEEKLANGSVIGSYGYLEPNGDVFMVSYIADQRGYRAHFENPLKLSFLRPIDLEGKDQNSNGKKNESNLRIVTPTENTSQNASTSNLSQQQSSYEQSNSFYYPQNLLENAEFNENGVNDPKGNKSSEKPHSEFSNFNSEKEENAFYYPQHILESENFNKPENSSDNIVFQKKIKKGNTDSDFSNDGHDEISQINGNPKEIEHSKLSGWNNERNGSYLQKILSNSWRK